MVIFAYLHRQIDPTRRRYFGGMFDGGDAIGRVSIIPWRDVRVGAEIVVSQDIG